MVCNNIKKAFTKWYYKKRYPVKYNKKRVFLFCPWYVKMFSFLFSISEFEEENKKYNEYGILPEDFLK